MRRYLLALDTDLLALDEKLGLEPLNYLIERQEQEPCDVVVLSLVDTGQTKLPSLELVLGGANSGMFAPAKFPTAPPARPRRQCRQGPADRDDRERDPRVRAV